MMKDRAYKEGHSVWNCNIAQKSTGGLRLWVTACSLQPAWRYFHE